MHEVSGDNLSFYGGMSIYTVNYALILVILKPSGDLPTREGMREWSEHTTAMMANVLTDVFSLREKLLARIYQKYLF